MSQAHRISVFAQIMYVKGIKHGPFKLLFNGVCECVFKLPIYIFQPVSSNMTARAATFFIWLSF